MITYCVIGKHKIGTVRIFWLYNYNVFPNLIYVGNIGLILRAKKWVSGYSSAVH